MMKSWMRGAVAVAALGGAMLAGAAQATIVNYDFYAPVNYFSDGNNYSFPQAGFSGRVTVDTAILAQFQPTLGTFNPFESVYTVSGDSALNPVSATWTVSGTPADALANAPLLDAATEGQSLLFQGTGDFYLVNQGRTSFFQMNFTQSFNNVTVDVFNNLTTINDSFSFSLFFANADTQTIDGYVLPTPGSGTISAVLERTRAIDYYDSNSDPLPGGSFQTFQLTAEGAADAEGPVDAPEPGALALLGLGLLALGVRRRQRAA